MDGWVDGYLGMDVCVGKGKETGPKRSGRKLTCTQLISETETDESRNLTPTLTLGLLTLNVEERKKNGTGS